MRRYFEEEMRYLHEEGKVFAEKHPDQARLLNIDSLNDRDPYVERLFEGFAFLAGRIHERLDDELPEYTQGLFSLLYPHFLRPVPALSIAEFKPRSGQVSEPTALAEGTEIRSDPVGAAGTVCRFLTTEEVAIRPLRIEEATLTLESDNTHGVTFRFAVFGGARVDAESMGALRLTFNADAQVAATMHLFFTRHVQHVRVRAAGKDRSGPEIDLSGQKWVVPAGFGPSDGVLPYSEYTFAGSRLLQEYFSFRSRFMCVDLLGLDRIGDLDDGTVLEVSVKFDRSYPEDRKFTRDSFRLHCCPIINLFKSDAEPIRVQHMEAEFRVKARTSARGTEEIYDVLRVVGIEEKTGRRHEYRPLSGRDRSRGENRFFAQSFRSGPDERRTAYLSLSYADEEISELEPEVLSLDVRVTNGELPREMLKENSIRTLGPEVPAIVDVVNLTQPTLIRNAPTDTIRDYFWQLLSHLSLNRASILNSSSLAEVLRLYDWSRSEANKRRIQGIRDVRWSGKDVTIGGSVLRGGEATIEVDETHFSDEGDLCLFGLVMSEFLSMYATINSFVHLRIVAKPSERTYLWQPSRGKRTPL